MVMTGIVLLVVDPGVEVVVSPATVVNVGTNDDPATFRTGSAESAPEHPPPASDRITTIPMRLTSGILTTDQWRVSQSTTSGAITAFS